MATVRALGHMDLSACSEIDRVLQLIVQIWQVSVRAASCYICKCSDWCVCGCRSALCALYRSSQLNTRCASCPIDDLEPPPPPTEHTGPIRLRYATRLGSRLDLQWSGKDL